MITMNNISLRLHLLFSFLTITILATWGYNYGRGDHAEIIPYALNLTGRWKSDLPLFVQNINSYFPNERFAVSYLLALFGQFLPLGSFFLHWITTYFLILGIYQVAQIYLKDYLAFMVVWLMMLPLWGINFGGNELYYNNFQASTISKTIAIWGLYFYLQNQVAKSFYYFSLATIFHLLAGIQIGFLLFGTYLINHFLENRKIPRIYFSQILFFFISATYAIGMKIALEQDTKVLSDNQYFQAMFYWKFNEHYAVLDFQKVGFILYFFCLIVIFYFFKKQKFFKIFILLQIFGAIIYMFGFYILQSNFITSLQWFKTTLWIKLFGIIAFMGIFYYTFSKLQKKTWITILGILLLLGFLLLFIKFNRIFLTLGTLGIIILIIQKKISDSILLAIMSWVVFCGVWNYSNRIPLDVFFFKDDKTELCKFIEQFNEKMCIIVPIHMTELESYSKKNVYVNFIATPKKNSYFSLYLKRIEAVYGLKPKNFPIKKEINEAKLFYNQQNWDYWQNFKQQGVTHIITEEKEFEGIKPIFQKGNWYLWKL